MATARAHPTAPHLPRHYYTTLGPRRRSIVVAREAEGGGEGPCGRHAGSHTVLPVPRETASSLSFWSPGLANS